MINKGFLTANRTTKGDEVYTPFYAVEPILKYLPKDKIIWLPFDEEWSAFYQLLKQNDFQVIRSSLKEKQDFFFYTPDAFDVIVSNPPFSKKDKVLERVVRLGRPFMLLLPLATLQGKQRFAYFKEGLQLLSFDSRIDYHTNGNFDECANGSCFASAYFCKSILPRDIIVEQLKKYNKSLKGRMIE